MKILEIEVIKANSPNVIARVDIQFEGFLLRGFKIIKDKKTGKEFVTPPSYYAGNSWRSLFKTSDPAEWEKIQKDVLQRYNEKEMEESIS